MIWFINCYELSHASQKLTARLSKISVVFQNHKFCKIRPNFLPIMHFLQESYEFVRKTQILQVCYSVEHFLQDSDNIFAKFASICKKFLQKM